MKLSHLSGACAAALTISAVALALQDAPKPTTGTVTGQILFEGEVPTLKPLAMTAEQSKGCCADGVSMNDQDVSLLVDEKKGVANVVVTLEVDGAKVEIPEKAYELDQQGCRFEPHVVIVPEGGTVAYLNSDKVSHNIHTYGTDGINQAVGADGKLEQKMKTAEVVKVTCDYHPWMTSYVYVTDATHWGLSGTDGKFSIEGVPAGEYKLTIWHEKLGKAKATVSVSADGKSEPVEVKMGLDSKKKKKKRRR